MLEPTLTCLAAYAAVVREHELEPTLASSEGLVRARLAVVHALVAQGWVPPQHVTRDVDLDTRLDHTKVGAARGFEAVVPNQGR